MRKLIIATCLILAAAAPAVACSCLGPHGAKQTREFAREMARNVVAIAEIEAVDESWDKPPRYRVIRTYVGAAPKTFIDETNFEKSEEGFGGRVISTCDASPGPGGRALVALYPPTQASDTGYPLSDRETKRRIAAARKAAKLEVGSTCSKLFLGMPGVFEMVSQEARKLGRTVSRFSAPAAI
ncbi:hypothetical protein G7078_03890 [Sphingomonas sinipercae]|uniref:Lipoprotein n=1 Tax=Sphingomonas sinipercae TaxID=2714944 RepID=A0A6G7ZM68_9SPHN|nr:hypothetical protein [Sphingomonas sinipercae]QIL02010.1 hypothetical protein G7078_03890 [Sphingomonas sinipercae]